MSNFVHLLFHYTCSKCGCGSGDSGCKECGCCRVCAGDKDSWGGAFNLVDLPEEFDRVRANMDKFKRKRRDKKKDNGKEKEKEDKSAFGLQLLFGGTVHAHTPVIIIIIESI